MSNESDEFLRWLEERMSIRQNAWQTALRTNDHVRAAGMAFKLDELEVVKQKYLETSE